MLKLSMFLAIGGTLTVAACNRTQTPDRPPPLPISMEMARQTALAQHPGTVTEEELEEADGRWVYEFDIVAAAGPHEVTVDAQSGQIIKSEPDAD